MAETFRSALTQSDLIASATVSCVTGTFVKLGERAIQAGELLTIGYGEQSGQDNAQGRIFMDIRDNGTAPGLVVPGKIRLQIYSPQNRPLRILGEWRTETLSSGATDRSLMIPLPEDVAWLSEDKKLVLEFMCDAATATVSKTNTKIMMDCTTEAV